MERKILNLNDFLSEQTDTSVNKSPESNREARSRIAASLVKSIFGDIGVGSEGGDSRIDVTKEVKDSLPYKGCGINEPFKIEKTPIGVKTFKMLLSYLNDKGSGDYTRALKELEDGRALIVGIRNKLSVKKETANQDRFVDSLYFIPGNASQGKTQDLLASNKKNESETDIYKKAQKIQEDNGGFILTYDEFYSIFEASEKKKLIKKSSEKTGSDVGDLIPPYQITTVPSLAYYGKNPINPKGTGIKMPGDTLYYLKESDLGHGSYKMLVEGEPISVGRYAVGVTKFETYKPADVFKENCGMQIHRSSTKGVGVCIGPWSAGCQVFSDYNEFKELISKCEKETSNNNKFIYALIQLDDIDPSFMSDALKGIDSKVTNKEAEEKEKKKKDSKSIEKAPIEIEELADFIRTEKDKFNSDERSVIDRYNEVIKSNEDWKKLLKVYGSKLWDDLDGFLSSSELEELNYKSKKVS